MKDEITAQIRVPVSKTDIDAATRKEIARLKRELKKATEQAAALKLENWRLQQRISEADRIKYAASNFFGIIQEFTGE